MSLLSVTVKKARYVGIQATQFNTYVTLKLQNVKSTTVTVKGPTPCWEQDFLFEINDINLGLLVEVWNKGVIWDRALGYHYLPLTSVAYNEECGGRWIELEAQLMMRGGAVVGTTGPTGHALLLDCRFEPPFDAEGTGGADLQRKLDLLNGALDAERAEQARRQMQYIAHSGYSEDSDYTSDLNYPVGQHANCSASQFRSAAHQMHTPQRSLEVSRENSYERDEYHMHGDAEPLYYNSQPRNNRIDTWSQYQPELRAQASVESAISWRTAAEWQSGEEQRRPSLERQNTLYDDMGYGYDTYTNLHIRDHTQLSQQHSYEEYYDSTSFPYQMSYVGEDSRQWDSGGQYFFDDGYGLTPTEYENIMNKRRSSVVQLPQVPSKQNAASSRYSDYNGMAPYRPRPRRTAASLPATPSSTPKRGRALPTPPSAESAGAGAGAGAARGRRLPRPPRAPPAAPPPPAGQTHVPYKPEPEKLITDTSYGYDSFGYQPAYQDATTTEYQDNNYNNTSYDDEGMQPFFDETPHATPPAAGIKLPWSETDTTIQFSYPTTSENDTIISKTLPTTVTTYLPQPPIVSNQEQYHDDQMYQQEIPYDIQQNQYQQDYGQQSQQFNQQYPQQQQYSDLPQQFQQQQLHKQNQELYQQQLQNHQFQLQQQQQQQKQSTQQIQTSVLTGAATLGSLVAGGAKKLGSLFGAAAAAVAAPTVHQQPAQITHSASTLIPFNSSVAPVTPFTTASTTVPVSSSLPDVTASVPVSAVSTTVPAPLHRTPSLRRQESIQRPPVRRIRTLPDAPDDLPPSNYDESAYDEEYQKTEYDESLEHDRSSLNKYNEDEYVNETILEETIDESKHIIHEDHSFTVQKPSPTRNGTHIRKPSVDSYHAVPSVTDRKTSQGSFHHEDILSVPTSQEEPIVEKSKEDRTKFHEVPEEAEIFDDTYDDGEVDTYHQDDEFREQDEKFDEQFNESEEYEHDDDNVFQEDQERQDDEQEFQEEQPKLTPKQRWHRAYNKIVIQLNVSTL